MDINNKKNFLPTHFMNKVPLDHIAHLKSGSYNNK